MDAFPICQVINQNNFSKKPYQNRKFKSHVKLISPKMPRLDSVGPPEGHMHVQHDEVLSFMTTWLLSLKHSYRVFFSLWNALQAFHSHTVFSCCYD